MTNSNLKDKQACMQLNKIKKKHSAFYINFKGI